MKVVDSQENVNVVTDYHNLMQKRIRKILLICSSYDAYILEEDGHLESQINKEYLDLNLSNPPAFKRVSSASEAMNALDTEKEIDLVISMYNIGELDVFAFSKIIKDKYPNIPFVLMTGISKHIYKRLDSEDKSHIDYIFNWHGNADLMLAIIKTIEDKMNADTDILENGVQSILLVEDSIRYYSTYLPAIYKLVLHQSDEFLQDALNEQQQTLRKRSRPKILLATNYSDAVELYEKYKENLLGVISDVGFVINKNDPSSSEKLDAGIDLCKLIKKDNPLMPFLLQSSQESIRKVAEELGVGFIVKYSKTLLLELSEYIAEEFAFGDFVSKDTKTGAIIARAKDLKELQQLILTLPEENLLIHSSQNHLSKWLYSRGLFSIATSIKILTNTNFESTSEMRHFLVNKIQDYRILLGQGVVAKFSSQNYNDTIWFARLGEGSLGGKGRGLAFVNSMLQRYNYYDKYPSVRVMIPRTVIVATDYFDQFIKSNGLKYVIKSDISDEEILSEFVSSRLPEQLVEELHDYIKHVKGPLAIRSSSKLEDSHYQPFAGVYSTYMIPLTTNTDQMLRLLGKAIKSVYASVYFAESRAYISATSNLLSEEKMAVIIQEVCGTEDNGYFFPTISGVARSLNFYPIGDETVEDGVVNIALGLGKLVVDGGQTLRFSPLYPKKALQLSTPELALRDTQREMYALSLKPEEFKTSINDAINLQRFEINSPTAKKFRNMKNVASTWDIQNQSISDSTYEEGRRIITFAHILKYDTFPLAEIVRDLLVMGQNEMKCPVEIEFAANLDTPYGEQKIFNFLQIRPIVDNQENVSLNWNEVNCDDSLIYAESALGVGIVEDVKSIVYIKHSTFDTKHTEKMAEEILKINSQFKADSDSYVLVGPGRWGSSDPWLGIPVKWNHISEAKVIVECGLENFRVEPSQGTHFFQNLTSFGIGYLTINPFMNDGKFDVDRLNEMPAKYEGEFIRVVEFSQPLYIFVDGRKNRAIIK